MSLCNGASSRQMVSIPRKINGRGLLTPDRRIGFLFLSIELMILPLLNSTFVYLQSSTTIPTHGLARKTTKMQNPLPKVNSYFRYQSPLLPPCLRIVPPLHHRRPPGSPVWIRRFRRVFVDVAWFGVIEKFVPYFVD